MKKKLIPTNNPIGSGTTQWVEPPKPDPLKDPEGYTEWLKAQKQEKTNDSSKFSWNNFVSHLGDIFNGIGSIVGNANSYSRTTDNTNRNIDEVNGRWSITNGTTLTVIVLGGIAVIITLILVLGNKK